MRPDPRLPALLTVLLPLAACLEQPERPERPKPSGADDALAGAPMVPSGGQGDGIAANLAPRIQKVQVLPERPDALQDLRAEVEFVDEDSPQVDLDYVWTLNDTERADLSTQTLPHDQLKKGDRVKVKVTASDGEATVERLSSEIRIVNAPPTFLQDPTQADRLDGLVLKAQDPDGDPLSFSVSGAPAGLTIDPVTGRISYQGSMEEPGGAYKLVVRVSDGDGGEARWEQDLQVSPGKTSEQAQKEAEAAAKAAAEKAAAEKAAGS